MGLGMSPKDTSVPSPGRLIFRAARSSSRVETDLFVCIVVLTLAVRGSGWRLWGHTCPQCGRISVLALCIPAQPGPETFWGLCAFVIWEV